jgi:hypothetical protein
MTKFSVLPTNEDFRTLSDSQIDLMIYSMNEDHREMELARKGLKVDSEYYDSSFEEEVWNRNVGDWDVLKEGHDADAIAKQVEELTREADKKNLADRFDGLDEYNAYREAGGKTEREMSVEGYIDKQIAMALEKAKMYEAAGGKGKFVDDTTRAGETGNLADLDKAAIDKNIALFNQKNDDDDFTML